MDIYINSKKISLDKVASLHEVLELNGFTSGSFAIAVNRKFVPRTQYEKTLMNDDDQIEIVIPMQGG